MSLTLNRNRSLHILLWLVYFVLLLFWFSLPFTFETAIWHAVRMLLIHMAIFYLNTRILLPAFVERKAWLYYFLIIVGSMALIYLYFTVTNEFLPFDRYDAEPQSIPRTGSRSGRPSRWIITNLSLSFGVFFISTLNFVNEQVRKSQEEKVNYEKEQLETEMKLLRSQINPHFMFNALNNIYALAIQKNKLTPEAIMKLSQMLRYVLYESNVEKVPVEKEWEYIENYIDIQLLKFEDDVQVTRQADIASHVSIAPMLLLPFVENAFKHSHVEAENDAQIRVLLSVNDEKISFMVFNSLPKMEISKDKEGGIGLANVQKRLDYLYPQKHLLDIQHKDSSYEVTLTIYLS